MPEPDELQSLGKRLDKARRPTEPRREAPPTLLGVAGRFATELGVAIAVGAGLGWLIDRELGTRPIFLLVMFVLGAAAGILNLMRAAAEINARSAGSSPTASRNDDEET